MILAADMQPLTAYRPTTFKTDRFFVKANITSADLRKRLEKREMLGTRPGSISGRDLGLLRQIKDCEGKCMVAVRVSQIDGEMGAWENHEYFVLPLDYPLVAVPEVEVEPGMATERG